MYIRINESIIWTSHHHSLMHLYRIRLKLEEYKENKLDAMQKRLFKTCKGLIIHHPIYMTDVYNTGITAVAVQSVHHHDYVKMQHLKYNVVPSLHAGLVSISYTKANLGKTYNLLLFL